MSATGADRDCPIERALNIVGDRWTLLTLQEIGCGRLRFNEIQEHIGIPRDRLAVRLRRLTAAGVVERRPYCAHPPRYEYTLTESGRSLTPVFDLLADWGRRFAAVGPPASSGDRTSVPCTTVLGGPRDRSAPRGR